MRQEAYLQATKRGKRIDFNVSAKAIQEEISFLNAKIESDIFAICERLYNESKQRRKPMQKTILEKDVIMANSFIEPKKREEVD